MFSVIFICSPDQIILWFHCLRDNNDNFNNNCNDQLTGNKQNNNYIKSRKEIGSKISREKYTVSENNNGNNTNSHVVNDIIKCKKIDESNGKLLKSSSLSSLDVCVFQSIKHIQCFDKCLMWYNEVSTEVSICALHHCCAF